jgi:hypothetical protein
MAYVSQEGRHRASISFDWSYFHGMGKTIIKLLEEFSNVFPEELPKGLPFIHGVRHQIELVLRVSLPNQPSYRCKRDKVKNNSKAGW